MPKIDINGTQIYYEVTGSGSETIVFSHGYLMSHRMFADQVAVFGKGYRVIAFDHRGHGNSDQCHAAFGMYDLVDDAAALIDAVVDGPVHFAGMSTGGYVGMRLLLRRRDLIKSLVLIDTGARSEEPEYLKGYNQLLFMVRLIGIRPLLGKVLPLLFADKMRTDPLREAEFLSWKTYIGSLNRTSIRRFGHAIFGRDDVLEELRALDSPPKTLIIVGEEDKPTPPAYAQEMHEAIEGSTLVKIPDSGHSSPVENPWMVTKAIKEFLEMAY